MKIKISSWAFQESLFNLNGKVARIPTDEKSQRKTKLGSCFRSHQGLTTDCCVNGDETVFE